MSGYNAAVPQVRIPRPVLRLFYRQFYNRFAFTYDAISGFVSRNEWREWTRTAIPFVRGPRVLEIAFGTGNLLLELTMAGYDPVGVDLSQWMVAIAKSKLERGGLHARLARARVQMLPFPEERFDSVVMTFPPGLIDDPSAMSEIRRVLCIAGRLIWVDAPYLYPVDPWSIILNRALRIAGGPSPSANKSLTRPTLSEDDLPRGWEWHIETIERRAGYVHVMTGTKKDPLI